MLADMMTSAQVLLWGADRTVGRRTSHGTKEGIIPGQTQTLGSRPSELRDGLHSPASSSQDAVWRPQPLSGLSYMNLSRCWARLPESGHGEDGITNNLSRCSAWKETISAMLQFSNSANWELVPG